MKPRHNRQATDDKFEIHIFSVGYWNLLGMALSMYYFKIDYDKALSQSALRFFKSLHDAAESQTSI
jgi:hypothetical protein